MLFQVTITYDPASNPVRTRHGMEKLMAFAQWMAAQTEFPDVHVVGQIYWSIDEEHPAGYGVFSCGRRERLQAYLSEMRRAAQITIHEIKPVDELLAEGAAKLEGSLKGRPPFLPLDRATGSS